MEGGGWKQKTVMSHGEAHNEMYTNEMVRLPSVGGGGGYWGGPLWVCSPHEERLDTVQDTERGAEVCQLIHGGNRI